MGEESFPRCPRCPPCPSFKGKTALSEKYWALWYQATWSDRVRELANLLEVSQYYFIQAIRNMLGQTPRHYVLHRRVTKAQELIQQEKLSLADVA